MKIKTITLALLLAAVPAVSFAATTDATNVQTTLRLTDDGYSFDKFSSMEGVESMTLDKAMLQMATEMGADINGLEGEVLKAIDKVTVATGSSQLFTSILTQDIATLKAGTTYKLLAEDNDGGEQEILFTRGSEDAITEVLVFSLEEGEATALKMEGNFNKELMQTIINKAKEAEKEEGASSLEDK